MMNCKEAIRLMSEEMDRDLAGSDRFALRLHKLICVGCRNYHKQLTFLRQACQQPLAADDITPPPPI
ncbi:zf-HC2 domain-containing protein [Candidatus Accumulibacter phosphatis]|uniref:Zf-HC2 domain-containing protein n=2 Tax=Candidatus Accumulibacter TaxID=327159 RepID=A0ABX1TBS2_9PROT|nr:zf-HC2 domain-containing protein [Accumulibacter sp.]NMQ06426.1 zf-HC2 domain-containing protein [Candidatus Accumulibacter contiguus]